MQIAPFVYLPTRISTEMPYRRSRMFLFVRDSVCESEMEGHQEKERES